MCRLLAANRVVQAGDQGTLMTDGNAKQGEPVAELQERAKEALASFY